MKRTIFCGVQEGPLTRDFLPGAPGLGCLPRARWCLLWELVRCVALVQTQTVPASFLGTASPQPRSAENEHALSLSHTLYIPLQDRDTSAGQSGTEGWETTNHNVVWGTKSYKGQFQRKEP